MRFPRALVFFIGFSLMVVEVASSRMVAPYIGVSVYTWTSVIGAVLLGIVIGNFVGGQLADRRPSVSLLGGSIAAAGIAVLLSNYVVSIMGSGLYRVMAPLWFKTAWFTFMAFFPAAFILSLIGPQVVRAGLREARSVGGVVGSLGAWNALGSIVGTFAAGFFLIAFFGTKTLIDLVAMSLMLVGLAAAWPIPLWKNRVAGLTLLFLVGDIFTPKLCTMETQYYCIRVDRKTEAEASTDYHYVLRLDHLVHSYVYPQKPDQVGYGYEQVYTNLIAMRYRPEETFSTLFIGGGGYSLPRYLERFYPQASMTVAEIDPGVTAANHRFMELASPTRIQTSNGDARMFLARAASDQKFDLVFGDAFNDFSVPTHLTTVEFHRLLKTHMTSRGVYALNIIDDAKYGQFLAAMTRTLQAVWQHVYVAPLGPEIRPGRNTIILLASDEPIDMDAWYAVKPPYEASTAADPAARRRSIELISEERVNAFLAGHDAPALTDSFAPTDRYLAPVFEDAY